MAETFVRNCVDCRVQVGATTGDVESYIVHDELWAIAGMESAGGNLCVSCLESRLGRSLNGGDFPTDVPINYPGVMRDTPRLYQLKSDAQRGFGLWVLEHPKKEQQR